MCRLTKIKASHTENKWFLGAFQKCDENSEKFVILVVQLGRILSPELLASVHRAPLKAAAADFCHIFIVAGEVLKIIYQTIQY